MPLRRRLRDESLQRGRRNGGTSKSSSACLLPTWTRFTTSRLRIRRRIRSHVKGASNQFAKGKAQHFGIMFDKLYRADTTVMELAPGMDASFDNGQVGNPKSRPAHPESTTLGGALRLYPGAQKTAPPDGFRPVSLEACIVIGNLQQQLVE